MFKNPHKITIYKNLIYFCLLHGTYHIPVYSTCLKNVFDEFNKYLFPSAYHLLGLYYFLVPLNISYTMFSNPHKTRQYKSKNIVLPILGPQGENKNTYKDRNSKLIEI